MKHIQHINEFLGFSKAEKEAKQKKLDIEELKKELSNYNWLRMTAQPGGKRDTWTNKQLIELIKIRLNQGKKELPYLYKLVPQLFEFKGAGTNATTCHFKSGGEYYLGIIPTTFDFVVDPDTRRVENDNDTKERALNFILQRYLS